MVIYLLDTNTISCAFRGEGGVAARLLEKSPPQIAIPAPVLYEARAGILRLAGGARRDSLTAALDRLVAAVAIAPFDAQAAEAAAAIRTRLDAAGTPIGPIDTQIAAIAASTSATLVTRNGREFSRIAGLSLENWYTEPVA